MEFLKRSEQVVLSSATDLKNRTGTLYLTTERLHWVESNGNYEETIYFSDVRSTLVSNATSKRVCLKLVTKQDPLGSVFYFTSGNARAELDNVKDTLCKLSKEKSSSKGERENNSNNNNSNNSNGNINNSNNINNNNDDKKDDMGFAGLDLNLPPSHDNKVSNHTHKSPRKNKEEPVAVVTQQPTPGPPPVSSQSPSAQHLSFQQQPQQSQPQQQRNHSHNNNFSEHEDYPYNNNNNNNNSNSNSTTTKNTNINIPSNNGSNNNYNANTNNPINNNNTGNTGSNNNKSRNNVQYGEEDDFFSMDGGDGSPGGKGGESVSKVDFEIEVRDPQQELESGSKLFVSYEVIWSRNGQPQQKVRRRYKDFEWLYNHIVGNYQHRTTIPPFPSKSILKTIGSSLPYLTSSDSSGNEFTQKRCVGLDKFMKSFVRSPILQQSRSLQVFLSSVPIEHEAMGVVGFLGKVESHLSGSAGTRKLDDIDVADQNFSDVEMDYKYVRELMMRWDLTPKKLPFEKFLVVVLGTTSAGKSAFVNHFFGLQVKRSAVGQMDTHFTLVETLPKEKFLEYSDKSSFPRPNFTDEELSRKISGDVYADPRYGYVFFYLDTFKTLSRYEAQFTNYAHYISNYGLVRSIVINEEYLRGNPEKIQLAKRTILLDSPGFDYTKENEHAMEKFLGNLKILQLFYSMSDLSLFMTPATHINMVSNQIATLELSVLYSLHGPEYVDKLLHEILSAPSTGASGTPTHLIPSIVDIKNYVVQRFMHAASLPMEGKKAEYKGTVVWDKIRFVLTKIDEVFVNQPVGNLHEQFFELGRLVGKNLTYLEAPTFSQCMAIGLPEHQLKGPSYETDARTGDLKVLLDLIRSLNSESSYMGRLEASVQMMCLELQSAIKASWSTWISPKQWMSSDTAQLQDIYRRSCLRLKKISMTGTGGGNGGAPYHHQSRPGGGGGFLDDAR